jgi:PAS domain S-box-containing protein
MNDQGPKYPRVHVHVSGKRRQHFFDSWPRRQRHAQVWRRFILASGEPGEMEARLRRFDGEHRWFLFRTCPLADASGQVFKWCGMNIDIEDRRRAEEALRGREGRFRSIVDGLPALVTLRTSAGDLEFPNRRYLEYFGTPLEELKGWAWGDNFHPDDRSDVLAAWRRSVETGLPCDIECRRRRADGVYRWFHMHGLPCEIQKGASSFGTSCTLISTTGSRLKLCSPVKSDCSKWWRAAIRCRECSTRSVSLSKTRPAVLLQRRVGWSERYASRTRSRTKPSGQLHHLHYWPTHQRRFGSMRDGVVPERASHCA